MTLSQWVLEKGMQLGLRLVEGSQTQQLNRQTVLHVTTNTFLADLDLRCLMQGRQMWDGCLGIPPQTIPHLSALWCKIVCLPIITSSTIQICYFPGQPVHAAREDTE
eukprot:2960022-Lingulodinium_polyedra.AAC.1